MKVDESFRAMWRAGVSSVEMAAHYGVTYPHVNKAAKAAGLASRGKPGPRSAKRHATCAAVLSAEMSEGDQDRLESIARPTPWTLAMDVALIRTDGAYSRIAELAEKWNMTTREALTRWHKIR